MERATRLRRRFNELAIVASAAFAGGNLFIGLSIGPQWLRMEPLAFMHGFWPQFTTFLSTIMPLFLLTLVGLAGSAHLDWDRPAARGRWLIAIGLFVAISLITIGFHMPENLRLREATYTADEAAAARRRWLLGHVPRVLLSFGIPLLAIRAASDRGEHVGSS